MGRRGGVHRVQPEVRILAELIDQRSTGLFQGHRHRTPTEAMVQSSGPARKFLWSLLQFTGFGGLGAGHRQLPTMVLIRPIDAYEGHEIRLGRSSIYGLGHQSNPPLSEQAAWFRRKAYSGVCNQTASEYSSGTKASRRSKDLPKASRVGEQEFVAAGRLLDSSLAHLATDEKPAHIPTGIRVPL
jgi:hypothetical protein